MNFSQKMHDIVFIGHVCYDEVVHGHENNICIGGAAVYGAIAAAKAHKKVAALLMYSPEDEQELIFLRDNCIDICPIYSKETTRVGVIHLNSNMDDRRVITKNFAGLFTAEMVPEINSKYIHLAGCNDHEFSVDFIKAMKKRNYSLSIDMQCLVRNNDKKSGEIIFKDDSNKTKIIPLMDKVKLDILEAKLLTGSDDLEKASSIMQHWGCPEIIITSSDGVLVRTKSSLHYTKFTNRSVIGRTGRGDTTFGAYLAWRIDHDPEESLRFAAALVSLKMESPGPFNGKLEDVLERMNN